MTAGCEALARPRRCAELKRRVSSCLVTTGEHEYSRYGFRELLERRCADVLQPDITWLGGITEARRVTAMAAGFDVPIVPHGSSVYSYHLQIAFPNCPIAELIMLAPEADRVQPYFGDLLLDEPLPVDGWVELDPTKPGFGVTLNRDLLRRPYEHAPQPSPPTAPAKSHADWLADPVTAILEAAPRA